MEGMIKVDRHGPVLRVQLNRPEVRNALNDDLIGALYQVFTTVSTDIRAIILGGEGPAFCAGGDLDWMRKAAAYTEEENKRDAMLVSKLWAAVQNCHAFTLANVHGAAMGGGSGLVACCDMAIATEDSKFAFSEVKLGLIPATIGPFVVDKIGKGHARALFATGEVFSAQQAYEIGLVHEVVASKDKEALITKKLRNVLSAGPKAVAGSKKLVLDMPLSYEETAARLAAFRASEEGQEGLAAFLEKRTASFVEQVPEVE
jgi:enoyl-CoA hydratase/carnithine racemase